MSTVVTRTERDLRARTIENHGCPTCGAAAGVRCRFTRPNITTPTRTTVDVRQTPCDARITLAWRDHLEGGDHGDRA